MSVEGWSADVARLQQEVRDSGHPCHFMHVDLVGSTLFKTRHQELEWLVRLRRFQEIVLAIAGPLNLTVKLLGDGILLSGPQTEVNAKALRVAASAVLDEIAKANVELLGESKIVARILLSSGQAFFFEDSDPQGLSVDKLFRMEKLVPDNCIGMTDDFLGREPGELPIAYFPLKGLPKHGNHGLLLVDRAPAGDTQRKLLVDSYSASVWLPSHDETQPFCVVGGYIQGPTDDSVQVGDMRAKIRVIMILMELGYAKLFDVCEGPDFPDHAFRDDIITVGGPCFNGVTKKMLERLPVSFDCDDDDGKDDTPLVERKSGERYEAMFEGGRLTKDWGLFVRCRNPNNAARTLVVACGIESPAVDGIVRTFSPSNPDFLTLVQTIRDMGSTAPDQPLPDFYCIMPFTIENGKAAMPTLAEQCERIRLIN